MEEIIKNNMLNKSLAGTRLQLGFNIIELLVIVVIIGVITALTAPSYSDFVRNQAIASVGTEIVSTFQTARSEAVKRSVPVKVCFKEKVIADTGSPDCRDPGDHSGDGNTSLNIFYIYAFVDNDGDNVQDNGEETILLSGEFNNKVILKQTADHNIGGSVEFNQKGGASFQASGAQTTAYIALCDDRSLSESGRLITISATGRVSLSGLSATDVANCS